MVGTPKVLSITRRTAELCGTQSVVYAAGGILVTATSMTAARSIINALQIKAVIVCRDSWTEAEREAMVAELAANHPDVTVVLRCPGCTGCDEASQTPGTLCNSAPVTQLLTALMPVPR